MVCGLSCIGWGSELAHLLFCDDVHLLWVLLGEFMNCFVEGFCGVERVHTSLVFSGYESPWRCRLSQGLQILLRVLS